MLKLCRPLEGAKLLSALSLFPMGVIRVQAQPANCDSFISSCLFPGSVFMLYGNFNDALENFQGNFCANFSNKFSKKVLTNTNDCSII